jgi:hypothetical protein
MVSREELKNRFDSLERELLELRRAVLGDEADPTTEDLMRAVQFLQAFYNAPDHRLQLEEARRAAAAAGLSPRALAGFYAGTYGALRAEGAWCVLTPSGQQWYEDNVASLMSRSE